MATGQPSHLVAALRVALRGLRGSSGAARGGAALVPRRRLAAERHGILVEPRRLRRYLEVTGGAGIAAFRGPDAVLPPTYPALWETALLLELFADGEIPFPGGGLIHLGGELCWVRPLRVDDRVRARVELDRVEPEPRGARLTFTTRNWNARGQLCSEGSMLLLLRQGGSTKDAGRSGEEGEDAPEPRWEEVARWEVAANHGRRYARVSGDFNPIHLWPLTSRLLGFERPILHGHCTGAMVVHSLVERRLGGDPASLRRLQIRFRAPLLLPSTVRLLAGADSAGAIAFRLLADGARKPAAEGKVVGG